MKNKLKLYLVTDRGLSLGRPLEYIIKDAVDGGVTMVQLREKDTPTGDFVELARKLMSVLKPLGVPLIINDRVDVALAVDADGVHIGQSDMAYKDVRRLMGTNKIIGLSVESIHDIEIANTLDVDYIGISPVYGTPTKTDTLNPFGLNGLEEAVKLSVHPTVGIGGMNKNTAAEVVQTGCNGIAVVSAICSAESPKLAAQELKQIIEAHKKTSWSDEVWNATSEIYKNILNQEFIIELADGSLPIECFARYIAQDEIYLKSYYPNMLKLADLMDSEVDKIRFTEIALSGMEAENMMHKFLMEKYNIKTDAPTSIVTAKYNSHIQTAVESGDKRLALAAMLPCMWIYNQVGIHILKMAQMENNPYKEWIAEYGNEEFTKSVISILKIIDKWAEEADDETKKQMNDLYIKAAKYEYAFWDYGYFGDAKNYEYID